MRLSRKSKKEWIPYRTLAGMSPSDRCRVGVELGLLPRLEGTTHKECGTKLILKDMRDRSSGHTVGVLKGIARVPKLCRYFCSSHRCGGMKHGLPVQSDEDAAIQLGGRGRAAAGEGVLIVCLACQPFVQKYTSVNDIGLISGISSFSTQVYLDEVRSQQARLNILEQAKVKFSRGMMVEIDETAVRAERIKCSSPCASCGPDCEGYRLRWNRWIGLVQRGDRSNMVILQLPFETSLASGGGVPLSANECDDYVAQFLGKGVIVFTDGAAAYEAFAAGNIKCSDDCSREDCLARAVAAGQGKCNGWRPRQGRYRFTKFYKQKQLSHGVVTHKKEEWAIVKSVRIHTATGNSYSVKLKHGTECCDGCWPELKQAIPDQVSSTDHERIATYVNAWAWRARHVGKDLFSMFTQSLKKLT